jgi:NDP-sugar pyrophosphorylase family protein
VGPYSVIGRQCQIEEEARIEGAIVWPNGRIGRDASVTHAIVGRNCHIGRSAAVNSGTVLGDKSSLTDYTRV